MSTVIDSPRRMALRLHALHSADRTWILSQIPEKAQTRLGPLLAELDELGFSVDQEMLDVLDASPGDIAPVAENADEYERHIQALNRAPAEWVIEQLEGEPRAVLNCLLSIHAWGWSESARPLVYDEDVSMQHDEPRLQATHKVRQILLREMARSIPPEFPVAAPAASQRNFETPASPVTRVIERILEAWRKFLWKR